MGGVRGGSRAAPRGASSPGCPQAREGCRQSRSSQSVRFGDRGRGGSGLFRGAPLRLPEIQIGAIDESVKRPVGGRVGSCLSQRALPHQEVAAVHAPAAVEVGCKTAARLIASAAVAYWSTSVP